MTARFKDGHESTAYPEDRLRFARWLVQEVAQKFPDTRVLGGLKHRYPEDNYSYEMFNGIPLPELARGLAGSNSRRGRREQ